MARVDKGNLSSRVYDQVRGALMSGKYLPGDRLRVAELANLLGTSSTPVREAIFRLVSEHALEMRAATAITVPELEQTAVSEIQLMRMLLEGAAAEAAARFATPEQIASMETTHAAFIAAIPVSPREAASLNRKFHFELIAAARMPSLYGVVEGLWVRMGPLLHVFHNELTPSRDDLTNHPHYEVLEGLRSRDGVKTSNAIKRDIEWGRTVLLEWMNVRADEEIAARN
ncbi:HTH-type transcriptional regulator McbR [compost metagenome]